MSVPCAHLRVYEPLPVFAAPEQARWRALAAAGGGGRRAGLDSDRRQQETAAVGGPAWPDEAGPFAPLVGSNQADTGFLLRGADLGEAAPSTTAELLVCPLSTRLRAWQRLARLLQVMPQASARALMPERWQDVAEAELDRWSTDPAVRAHVETEAWAPALQWFVLVDQGERVVRLGRRGDWRRPTTGNDERSVVFRTRMGRARQRAARALVVLRRTVEDGPVLTEVERLARWLELFHPHSVVELDYGDVVHLLDDDALVTDTTAADVASALAGLDAADPVTATQGYQAADSRWRPMRALGRQS